MYSYDVKKSSRTKPAYKGKLQEELPKEIPSELSIVSKAMSAITNAAHDAANTIITLSQNSAEDRIRLDAAKHILKVVGLEVDHKESTVTHYNLESEFSASERANWMTEALQ